MTTADALLHTGEDICNTLLKAEPASKRTRTAIDALVNIFKGDAEAERMATDIQRAKLQQALAQRVDLEDLPGLVEASDDESVSSSESDDDTLQRVEGQSQRVGPGEEEGDGELRMEGLAVTYPSQKDSGNGAPIITPDEDGPARNT